MLAAVRGEVMGGEDAGLDTLPERLKACRERRKNVLENTEVSAWKRKVHKI